MTTTTTSGVDPSTVPPFPVVHLRVTDDGRAEFDGTPVDTEGNPIDALVKRAAHVAASRPMRAVRAVAHHGDHRWTMVIDADGNTYDLPETIGGATAHRGRSVPARGTHDARDGDDARFRKMLAAGTAGALLLVGLGGGTIYALNHREAPTGPTEPVAAPAGESPVVPVPGLTRRATWVSPPLAEVAAAGGDGTDRAPVVTTDDQVIAVTATDDATALTGMRAKDGATLWTSPLPEDLTAGPQNAVTGGHEAIAATTSSQLLIWPATGADTPAAYDLPTGSTLVPHSPVPVVWNEDARQAHILTDTGLAARVMPAEARPLIGRPNGTVIAADDAGHWWPLTAAETAPEPEALQPPQTGATPTGIIGVVGRTVLYGWRKGGPEDTTAGGWITGYAAEKEMHPAWNAPVSTIPASDQLAFSPDGTWAIAGALAIDPDSGAVRRLNQQWQTTGMTDSAAWSLESTPAYRADRLETPKTIVTPPEDAAGVPVDETKTHALLIAPDQDQTRIYALKKAR